MRLSFAKAIALALLVVGAAMLARTGTALASSPLPPPVEVFDVKQERVVNTMPLSGKLKRIIIKAINDSPTPYGGVTMNPTSGIIVHVRFEKPTKLSGKLYPEPINEAYLFLDRGKSPLALLFFSNGHRPRVYTLQADPDRLIQAVQPES